MFYCFLVPADSPVLLETASTPRSSVLSWNRPLRINAPLLAYRIHLDRIDPHTNDVMEGSNQLKEVTSELDRHVVRETISRLEPDTEYQLRVAVVNEYGEGPSAQVRVATQTSGAGKSSSKSKTFSFLFFANSVAFYVWILMTVVFSEQI